MGADSLIATLRSDQPELYVGSQHHNHDRYGQKDSLGEHATESHTDSRESWSIRGLLSRRLSRRYRVLEREPNRLRKRSSTTQ